jgi:hypothetical protein
MDDETFRERSAELIATILRLFPEEGVATVIVRQTGQVATITNLPPDAALDLLRAASDVGDVGDIEVIAQGSVQ